jgi:hypothetical protein
MLAITWLTRARLQVERYAGMKLSFRDALKRVFNKIPLISYTGPILLFTALLSWPLTHKGAWLKKQRNGKLSL